MSFDCEDSEEPILDPLDPSGCLTPTETKELLERLGIRPSVKLGQNFLIDANIVRKSLSLAGVCPGDRIVEVGPGLGTLTGALLASGAEVFAIEFDAVMHGYLESAFHSPKLHLLRGDGVEIPLAGLTEVLPVGRDFKVVANLPYAIATPWMEGVLGGPLPAVMVLMLQRECAERFCATAGSKAWSAISVFIDAVYQRMPGHSVSRRSFYPVPGVDSVLLRLERRNEFAPFDSGKRQIIRTLFTQRRKQIGGSARRCLGEELAGRWLTELAAFGLDERARPEIIPTQAWRRLPV